MTEKEIKHSTQLTGQAGVWQVASQLAMRQVNPMFPGVDYGFDLMLETGIRIQVKSTRMRFNRVTPNGGYWFKFWNSKILGPGETVVRRGARDYSLVSDFMVLWGIDENRFWVIPSSVIAKTQCVALSPAPVDRRVPIEQIIALRSQRMTQEEIGARLGISQVRVSQRLIEFDNPKPARTLAARLREFEDRWDLIVTAAGVGKEVARLMKTESVASSKETVG